ncbi:MAG: NADH-quinone oxidoreductase subunit NuoF [Planctomycetota bacterium]|nr:NADH-quinone oxidoreductase subunit NuoF [Planctomycetota bacterium]
MTRRTKDSTGFEKVLLAHVDHPDSRSLDHYRSHGGYETARRVLSELKPDEVIEEVKASDLRGRGGAGFPCGMKWGFVPKQIDRPKYLVVNADESEPGTFKDRVILERDPHQLLEGMIIAAYAIDSQVSYVYIRGEFVEGYRVMQKAIEEACAAGVLGDDVLGTGVRLDVTMHRGAGAYICGEETGLLNSLEGKRGLPRIKPPFPAVEGLFGCPTVVNNVETLVCLSHIFSRGVEWFKSIGPESGPGPKLLCVSGHVERPGVFEVPMGINLLELLEMAGGVWKGRQLKCVIPGGTSAKVLRADECDVDMDFDSLAAAGTMLGSGGVIVMDETTDMVDALYNILRFYHHESCGQCTPCREGTGWLQKIVGRIRAGAGRPEDLDLLIDICERMIGRTICVLADAAAFPCESIVRKFRGEFEERIRAGTGHERLVPVGGPLVQIGAISAHNQERLEKRSHG